MPGVEARRERLQRREEVAADFRLDALTAPGDREARSEPRQAVEDGGRRDQRDEVSYRRRGRIGLERVDRALDRPRDRERRVRSRSQARDAESVARSVAPDVAPDRPSGRGQPRLPAACGERAA